MKFFKYWFPVVLYCCMIFGVSSIQGKDLPEAVSFSDKVIHMTEYAILAVLVARAVTGSSQKPWPMLIWVIAVAFVAFYGVTDEFHQSFVSGRSSDLNDWMADLTGGSLGALLYMIWFQIRQRLTVSRV